MLINHFFFKLFSIYYFIFKLSFTCKIISLNITLEHFPLLRKLFKRLLIFSVILFVLNIFLFFSSFTKSEKYYIIALNYLYKYFYHKYQIF